MAKKKGGRRPPKNVELLRGSNSKQQSVKEVIKKTEAERGLSHVQRQNVRKTGNKDIIPKESQKSVEKFRKEAQKHVKEPTSKIILKNKIEQAKKQPQKEPPKAPQKNKQHEVKKDR